MLQPEVCHERLSTGIATDKMSAILKGCATYTLRTGANGLAFMRITYGSAVSNSILTCVDPNPLTGGYSVAAVTQSHPLFNIRVTNFDSIRAAVCAVVVTPMTSLNTSQGVYEVT